MALHLRAPRADECRVLGPSNLDTASPQFVRAVAASLRAARGRRPLVLLAIRKRARFRVADLRRAEAGRLPLDLVTMTALANTYGVALEALLPSTRDALVIRSTGLLVAGGRVMPFEPNDANSLVAGFVRLMLVLRDTHRPLDVRSADLATVATYLDHHHLGPATSDAVAELLARRGDAVHRDTIHSLLSSLAERRMSPR